MQSSTQVQSREMLIRNADERRAVDDYPLYNLIGSYEKRKDDYWSLCPFHADRHADNFHVWYWRGHGWRFKCHVCGAEGNAADYLINTHQATDYPTALVKLGIRAATGNAQPLPPRPASPPLPAAPILPPPAPELWRGTFHALFDSSALLDELMQQQGFSDPMTVVRFQFGYVARARQFDNQPAWIIPFEDERGEVAGLQLRRARKEVAQGEVRYKWYLPADKADNRVPARLFYADDAHLPSADLWIVEGAFKAALLWETGRRAIGVPGVANAGLLRLAAANGRFEGYSNIYIAFDNDTAGQEAAAKIPMNIGRPCQNVKVTQ